MTRLTVKCHVEVVPETVDHVTRWVVMPCTFDPHHSAPFTLRCHVVAEDNISARISQLREISTAELCTTTVKVWRCLFRSANDSVNQGRWTGQSAGGSILSSEFYVNPQYCVISDGDVHVTLMQHRTDFEDLIGLYLAALAPTGVNRWSSPTLLDDTTVTSEISDAAVLAMSDFSLNTEAHVLIPGCLNKDIIVVPATAQCGTMGAFELQFTHMRGTHVTVRSVNVVSYRHKHSASHALNRWQYLLVPDVAKNRTDHVDFDIAVSIDLPNLDTNDDYGFYLLKSPSKSWREFESAY